MTATRARAQLERILGSPGFDASARNRRFLEYVVEETLAGRADRLKGLSIAIDVFDRDATIDPQHDPVVRVEAAKLRRSLERYYLSAGREDPIRIDIPKGAYVPTFEERVQPPSDLSRRPAAKQGAAAAVASPAPRRRSLRWPTAVGLAIVLGVMLAVVAATAQLWLARAPADRDGAQAVAGLQLEGPAVVVAV
jgi:adenylate cyclase